MQRRVNVLVPFGCPNCDNELLITLDLIHEERLVWCARCNTMVPLRPEDLTAPPAFPASPPTLANFAHR
jgi:transcription elongation factor Elf1